MQRTIIGIGLGGLAGFATGYLLGYLSLGVSNSQPLPILFGTILAGAGAMTGAIAGGVGDIIAFLQAAFEEIDMTSGPVADYKEPGPQGP